jgi:hypothetical protein
MLLCTLSEQLFRKTELYRQFKIMVSENVLRDRLERPLVAVVSKHDVCETSILMATRQNGRYGNNDNDDAVSLKLNSKLYIEYSKQSVTTPTKRMTASAYRMLSLKRIVV